MNASAIEIRDVRKVYGEGTSHPVTALDALTLEIRDNEFFTLLGPSGCGKTTLLRLIAGFERASAGEILLFGRNVEGVAPHRRPVNTVFQHYALFPHMTVAENVAFGLRMLRRSRRETARIADEMLELVKLARQGARKPDQLSGGQQQRVALARALATSPRVLLLDEPLSALDLKLRQEMRLELKTLQRETGITFIFVTHDQEEALTMSDRIGVVRDGRLQQVGAPDEIYENPTNRFVAGFMGETNILGATVVAHDGPDARCRLESGIEIDVAALEDAEVGSRVTLSLRPENVALVNGAPDGVAGRIEDRVYLGTDTTYRIVFDDGSRLRARARNAAREGRRFAPGAEVSLRIAPGAARVLRDP